MLIHLLNRVYIVLASVDGVAAIEEEEKEENNEDNKIVNCYREFLLKNKLQQEKQQLDDAEEEEDEEDEEDIIMKRYVPSVCPSGKSLNTTSQQHQQGNVWTAGELIEAECKEASGGELVKEMVAGLGERLKEVAEGQETANARLEKGLGELAEMQRQLLASGQKTDGNFQANMNTQMQFQMQMQVQQMMFNMRFELFDF